MQFIIFDTPTTPSYAPNEPHHSSYIYRLAEKEASYSTPCSQSSQVRSTLPASTSKLTLKSIPDVPQPSQKTGQVQCNTYATRTPEPWGRTRYPMKKSSHLPRSKSQCHGTPKLTVSRLLTQRRRPEEWEHRLSVLKQKYLTK
jgi:hypothetical protein